MTPPTAAVLRAAADGDVDARARVIDAILPSVMGWCSRLGGQKVDAEDAAHDVCIVTLERLPTLRSPEAFSGWVFGITRRVLAKHRRRATWWSWMPLSDELPARSAPVDELGGLALGLLDRLPAAQREVLVLCGIEERTCQEAATLLALPLGTVKSRLRLARDRFRREADHRGVLEMLAAHIPGEAV